jgi:cation transport regulator ChaB
MPDPNETRALKASVRGALDTAAQLASLAARVDALDEQKDIDNDLIEELARVTAAHAVASAAVRGLVVTMQGRRGADTSA